MRNADLKKYNIKRYLTLTRMDNQIKYISGNRVNVNPFRGFKSHSLRQKNNGFVYFLRSHYFYLLGRKMMDLCSLTTVRRRNDKNYLKLLETECKRNQMPSFHSDSQFHVVVYVVVSLFILCFIFREFLEDTRVDFLSCFCLHATDYMRIQVKCDTYR